MKTLQATLICELMKLRRSRILWVTVGLFVFIPIMIGLLMFIAQNPEIAEKLGLIGTKAQLFSDNTWIGYMEIVNQLIAIIGLIGFGFVCSWVFGREYMERTLIDILALPVSRTSIVVSKFIIVLLWCTLLSVIIFVVSIILGKIMQLPGWSIELFLQFAKKYFWVSLLTIAIITPVGFIASYGRGIIAALGFVIMMLIMAQFISLMGIGPYFPYAIPGILTVPAGTHGMELQSISYVIVILTSILGFVGTIYWWRTADQH